MEAKWFILLCMCAVSKSNGIDEPAPEGECSRFAYDYRIIDSLVLMKNELAILSKRLEELENKDKQPVIATHVRLSMTTALTGTQRAIYDEQVVNIGNAYDTKRGLFDTPVSGLYLLHLTVCDGTGTWVDMNIVKEFTVIGRAFAGDAHNHNCGSEAIVYPLKAGDTVWVERAARTSQKLDQNHGWNSFTVVLLSEE